MQCIMAGAAGNARGCRPPTNGLRFGCAMKNALLGKPAVAPHNGGMPLVLRTRTLPGGAGSVAVTTWRESVRATLFRRRLSGLWLGHGGESLFEAGDVFGAGGDGDRGAFEVVADGLEAAAKLFGQEGFGDRIE
jgi:hypothetical protein